MKLNYNKLRIKRIEKGFSQEYIASMLEISQAKYSRIENGKTEITISQFGKLINILELYPLDLITLSDKLNI